MTTTTCRGPECERPITSTKHGTCRAHAAQIDRGRPLKPLRARTVTMTATCTITGCDDKPVARNMCSRHYQESRRLPRCNGPDCDRPVEVAKHGLCKPHTKQLLRRGDLAPLQAPRGSSVDPDAAPTCHPDRTYYARDLCHPCYTAARRKPPKPKRLCGFEGCGRPHSAHGWCSAHAHQAKAGNGMFPIGSRKTGPEATGRKPRKSRAKNPVPPNLPANWFKPTKRVKPTVPTDPTGTFAVVDFLVPELPDKITAKARRNLIAMGADDLLDMLGLDGAA